MTIGVHTDLDAYRFAVAELPVSASESAGEREAVVVVRGDGDWCTRAGQALAAGAAALVVARPADAPADAIAALVGHAGDVPVVIERPLLRADVAAAVAGHEEALAAVAVECHAPPGALAGALRDAVGWARVVTAAPLERRGGAAWNSRMLALLETPARLAVSLVAATQPGAPAGGRVRLTAIGSTRVEVDADLDTVVAITDASGRRLAPARFEGSERVALRRAIAALQAAEAPADLVELHHDARLSEALLIPGSA